MRDLLPPEDVANPPEFVSPHCRSSVHGGVRFITVRGQLLGCYEPADRAAERSLWVQVYRAGHATQGQIARQLKIGRRTFHGWVSRYRQEGMAGLLDRPKSGRPPKADAAQERLVWRSRAAGKTIYELAQLTNLSCRTVNRILGRRPGQEVPGAELGLEAKGAGAGSEASAAAVAATVAGGETGDAAKETAPAQSEPGGASAETVPAQSEASGAAGSETAPTGGELGAAAAVATLAAGSEASAGTAAVAPAAGGQALGQPARGTAEAAEAPLSSSHPGVNPLDRGLDRVLARFGLLEDAEPVFAAGQRLPWVGSFLALALLGQDPLLPVARRVFGAVLGPAFYGLRTVMVTLVLLALLRIKRPEELRQYQAQGLGRVLGLDRAPEVKTLRRKLHQLSGPLQGAAFMEALARERAAAYAQAPRVVYLDGHVEVYTGQYLIGQVYAASRRRVVKGTTRTWVNQPGGRPLFCVTGEFNEGLVAALPGAVAKVQAVLGQGPLTVVFDRGGYCGRLFEQQVAAGHAIITYRRGSLAAWPLAKFERKETVIGARKYAYAPAEAEVEIPVYEPAPGASGQKGAPPQGKTGRTVRLREIRVVRQDGGQTSILAANTPASAVAVCALLFGRWGAQENVFKYLLANYALDATVEYGDEPLSPNITHPNPELVKRQKALRVWTAKRDRGLAKLGIKLTAEPLGAEALAERLARWQRQPVAAKVQAAQARIDELRAELAQLPERVSAGQSGLRRLKSEMKLLCLALKLTAYHLETQLLERLRPHYPNHGKEGRKLIVAALRSPGSIRLAPGKILVKLAPQASPNRTKAVAELGESLNRLQPVYPGTNLRLVFEDPRA